MQRARHANWNKMRWSDIISVYPNTVKISAIINTRAACAVLTVLPSVSSVPDPKPTSMSKALKVRHLGWLMRTMGESVHWINWVSKELNIYPSHKCLCCSRLVILRCWLSICPGDTDHFWLGIYISGERPVKVRSSRGQLYPCSSFTDEMSLHGLIFTSSLKLSQYTHC